MIKREFVTNSNYEDEEIEVCYSDISGKELDEDNAYEYNGKHYSCCELEDELEIAEYDVAYCEKCGRKLNGQEDCCYKLDDEIYCEDCLDEELDEYYKVHLNEEPERYDEDYDYIRERDWD